MRCLHLVDRHNLTKYNSKAFVYIFKILRRVVIYNPLTSAGLFLLMVLEIYLFPWKEIPLKKQVIKQEGRFLLLGSCDRHAFPIPPANDN